MHSHFTNRPTDILSSWIVQEILSPQILRPEQYPAGGPAPILSLENGPLPWEREPEDPGPDRKFVYQVILDSIDLDKAIAALYQVYLSRPPAFSRSASTRAGKEAILAVVVLDDKGRMTGPSGGSGLTFSPFAWGLPRALTGDLRGIGGLREIDGLRGLTDWTSPDPHPQPARGYLQPLNKKDLDEVRDNLIRALGLPRELMTGHCFVIRTTVHAKARALPDPLLFNPSLIKDLKAVQTSFAEGRASHNLQLYLGHRRPHERTDILQDAARLKSSLAPRLMPPVRWPDPFGRPLLLLQQAAVNLAMRTLTEDGLLAVNGPPGTGKTTLLRDMMAAIIASRAEAMSAFADPAEAFSPSGHRIPAGGAWLHIFKLDARLKGFEILITSSNNKAVENISAELPAIHSIRDSGRDLDYFRSLSDALLQRKTWGLVAAVLGNAANREHFRQRFWWDKQVGFSGYLATRLRNRETAITAWRQAKADFLNCLDKSRAHLSGLEKGLDQMSALPAMQQALRSARLDLERQERAVRAARAALVSAQDAYLEAVFLYRQWENRVLASRGCRPAFFARVVVTKRVQAWKRDHAFLKRKRKAAALACRECLAEMEKKRSIHDEYGDRAKTSRKEYFRSRSRITKAENEIAVLRGQFGPHLIDDDFFKLPHRDRHLTPPWFTKKMQGLRDDVFMSAIRLHKAFIDAAARPLRHNLGALMRSMAGLALTDADIQPLAGELWSSLFLVIPCLSTTFASLHSMFGKLPPASLGWLFIDEAGQALPQAAAGAIMRTKRAVVVGDPMQIEPVTRLPEILTREICRRFSVDPDRFNAPLSSVQTLADAASCYFTEFEGRFGLRQIGIPLLVHRRCEEPMFGISNAIAYDGLMVQARSSDDSPIRDVLGASRWIDVSGHDENKWCPEEGEIVLDMLRRLQSAGVKPELFIITPFSIVAGHLRRLIRQRGILDPWSDEEKNRWVNEHIGTVHTVQGREAEAVILVLGSPLGSQRAAREWAGRTPNLLNVAVTRATRAFYVVGNRALWKDAGVFGELDGRLPG